MADVRSNMADVRSNMADARRTYYQNIIINLGTIIPTIVRITVACINRILTQCILGNGIVQDLF